MVKINVKDVDGETKEEGVLTMSQLDLEEYLATLATMKEIPPYDKAEALLDTLKEQPSLHTLTDEQVKTWSCLKQGVSLIKGNTTPTPNNGRKKFRDAGKVGDTNFSVGENVVCTQTSGNLLTVGKVYKCLDYKPTSLTEDGRHYYRAEVTITANNGMPLTTGANRFTRKEVC